MTKSFDRLLRVNRLTRYNEEKARGIVHTYGWNMLMRKEQEWFDNRAAEKKQTSKCDR